MPRRRTVLKIIHWTMLPLLIWFVLVTPDDVLPFGQKAFQFHSILALFFVTLCLLWTADYLRRGLASRPGPKSTHLPMRSSSRNDSLEPWQYQPATPKVPRHPPTGM